MRAAGFVALALLAFLLADAPARADASWLALLGLDEALGADRSDTTPEAAESRFLESAHESLESGDISAAERYFEAALATNPNSVEALTYLGLLHESAGRTDLAISMYQRVLVLTDLRAAATGGLGADPWAPHLALAQARLDSLSTPPPAVPDERSNVVARFQSLAELQRQGAIDVAESEPRRAANLGALLPQSGHVPAAVVFLPAPSTVDIVRRLASIEEFRTRGVLSDDAYVAERSAILDGLMPLEADDRSPPSAGVAPTLDELIGLGLITRDEALTEWEAAGLTQELPSWAVASVDATEEVNLPPMPTSKPSSAAPAEPESVAETEGPTGLHLASFRTPEQADLGWSQLLASNGDVLANLKARIVEVDHGDDTGVFFEVRAGPLPSEAAALAACDALIARGLYCATMPF